MKLKGDMVITLTDKNTGEEQKVHETNMVTNVVNDIFSTNPQGIWFNAFDEYGDRLLWNGKLLPICPNMIGGILLFSKPLEEKADNIYPSSDNLPVAYASNNVNSGKDVQRGSMNLTESKALDNGYKFVWEFTPSQGNGTITAVALTSSFGGTAGWGSIGSVTSPFLYVRAINLGNLKQAQQMVLFRAVEIDFEKGLLYSIEGNTSGVVTIRKYRYPIFTLGLNERLDDTTVKLLDTKTINCNTFKILGDYTPYGAFFDGHDGYWYGFSNQKNTSGNAAVFWVKIKKTDYSMTEGKWTLANVKLHLIGTMEYDSYPSGQNNAVIRNGYLYVLASDNKGIYKINLNNSSDVSLIAFGFTSAHKSLGDSGSCESYLVLVGDLIIGYDFLLDANDKVQKTAGGIRCENIGTPLFRYKHLATCFCSSYGSEFQRWYLLTPYLASINNLSAAVVKNADKTMKITYTLTEETESS
jgi:hypothetical protein